MQTNQERRDGGLIPERFIDPNTGKEFDKIYDDYVPLRGDMDLNQEDKDDFADKPRVLKNLFGARGRPDRKAKGRVREDIANFYARDILASLFSQNQKAINDSARNKVGLSFLNLVRGIADGDIEADLEQQRMMQDIASVYFDVKDIPDRDAKGFDIDKSERGKRVLVVRENGKDVYILFNDARIARAMKGFMTPDSVGSFTRPLVSLTGIYLILIQHTILLLLYQTLLETWLLLVLIYSNMMRRELHQRFLRVRYLLLKA